MSESESKLFNHPILITGGAGFLGSHMVALYLEKLADPKKQSGHIYF